MNEKATRSMSPVEVAALLGVSTRTLAQWRARGIGPKYLAISRSLVIYREESVQEWIKSREVESSAQAELVLPPVRARTGPEDDGEASGSTKG